MLSDFVDVRMHAPAKHAANRDDDYEKKECIGSMSMGLRLHWRPFGPLQPRYKNGLLAQFSVIVLSLRGCHFCTLSSLKQQGVWPVA